MQLISHDKISIHYIRRRTFEGDNTVYKYLGNLMRIFIFNKYEEFNLFCLISNKISRENEYFRQILV